MSTMNRIMQKRVRKTSDASTRACPFLFRNLHCDAIRTLPTSASGTNDLTDIKCGYPGLVVERPCSEYRIHVEVDNFDGNVTGHGQRHPGAAYGMGIDAHVTGS